MMQDPGRRDQTQLGLIIITWLPTSVKVGHTVAYPNLPYTYTMIANIQTCFINSCLKLDSLRPTDQYCFHCSSPLKVQHFLWRLSLQQNLRNQGQLHVSSK